MAVTRNQADLRDTQLSSRSISSHRLSQASPHGRANQQLAISDAVPPTLNPPQRHFLPTGPPLTDVLRFSLLKEGADAAALSAVRTPAVVPSNHARSRAGLPQQRLVFFWAFYLRRVPPCVRVPAFDAEHAKVCLRHPRLLSSREA